MVIKYFQINYNINIDKTSNKYYNKKGESNMKTFTYKEHLEYKDIFSKHWKAIDEDGTEK